MDIASLILLLMLAALGWFWFDSLRALENARNAGRQVCRNVNVQFLDDTVASTGLALVRDEIGRRVLRRTYRFEFSETGNSRLEGQLILFGSKVESVTMEPYKILPSTDIACEPARFWNPCEGKRAFSGKGGAYGGSCGYGRWNGAGREPARAANDESFEP